MDIQNNTNNVEKKSKSKESTDVKRFLNRLLGCTVFEQFVIFNYFAACLAAEINLAKLDGTYNEGVSDLPGSKIVKKGPPKVVLDMGMIKTCQQDVLVDRGISFEAALAKLRRAHPHNFNGFYVKNQTNSKRQQVLLRICEAGTHADDEDQTFKEYRPNTGQQYRPLDWNIVTQNYTLIDEELASEVWQQVYELSETECAHGSNCSYQSKCQYGLRIKTVTILYGSIVKIWGILERILQSPKVILAKAERSLRIVRVKLDDGSNLVGVRYPTNLVEEAVKQIVHQFGQETIQQNDIQQNDMQLRQVEEVTPIDLKSCKRASRAPVSMLDFLTVKKRKKSDKERDDSPDRNNKNPCSSISQSGIKELVDMGFPEKDADIALKRAKGNLQLALEFLL
eukprot:TRINITY_DN49881_c0_g1_i1.p1 TRINITY_DN49881_c0_g1~~TRINITY_DN49881_c0_g1_i1.p1  ORF type:complete len:395 (+),score=36.28 TRINITY_DN49881_c0_g1_i1:133-1317(+)